MESRARDSTDEVNAHLLNNPVSNLRSCSPGARLRAISLFTGAGGLDLGFEAAGFETVVSIERDRDARATVARNRPAWGLLPEGDALKVSALEVMAAADVRIGDIDLVLGGPPCQPFSKSAFWSSGQTRRLEDPRSETLGAMMDLIEATLPRAVVIENVRGIAYRTKDEGLQFIRRRFREINGRHGTAYKTIVTYLQATSFGVPQVRERAFIVSFRSGQRFRPPVPTHGALQKMNSGGILPIPTAWDAIGGLMPPAEILPTLMLKGKWAALIASIPEGQNYLWHTSRGSGLPLFGWRTRFWSFLLKLAKDQPSWTIQAEPGPATGPFHWDNRLLSIAEMCRLQSFPEAYQLVGHYRSARRQVGNAVPPALAEAVARRMRSILLNETYSPALSLAISQRADRPPPASPAAVPAKYLLLLAEHAAHPGSGKGPGTARRVLPQN